MRQLAQPKRLLDPIFTPPTGGEDAFETGPARVNEPAPVGIGIDGITGVPVTQPEGPTTYALDTPDAIYIIDQKLRRAPGGQQVVDIVIDVEEIIGALEYEVQIAKA